MTRPAPWPAMLLLATVLAASLLLKAAGSDRLIAYDEPRFVRDLAAALRAQGYRVETGSGNWWAAGLVTARKGDCLVQLRNAGHFGQERESVTRSRMQAGPLVYVYRGQVQADFPRYRTELTWRLQRELGRIGIAMAVRPPIAMASPMACRPDPAVLGRLRLHLR